MAQHIYKLLLGWRISFKDLEYVDKDNYTALRRLCDLCDAGANLSLLDLQFSRTQNAMGLKTENDLIEGGRIIPADNENFPDYLVAC